MLTIAEKIALRADPVEALKQIEAILQGAATRGARSRPTVVELNTILELTNAGIRGK